LFVQSEKTLELESKTEAARAAWNPITAVVDIFDSVWLGIFLIVVIFLYSAVGSAVPVFRQFFELTEFQYFNHPIFVTLIVLFCVTLTVTTLRRIQFNLRNLGVLTVHTGLLVLCAGSVVYFGRKIEGDVWLDAPRIRVVSTDRLRTSPESAVLAEIVARKGEKWETAIPMLGGTHRVEVTDVRHEGMATAHRVTLTASVGDGPPRTIELEQDPDRKEKLLGKISDRLAVWLVPANVTDIFYDETTPQLMARRQGQRESERFELPGLPYYSERFVPGVETITDLDGSKVESRRMTALRPLERWAIPIDLDDPDRASSADWPISISIDGYLPYARLDPRPVPGEGKLMPIVQVRLSALGETRSDWLVAEMPEQSMLELDNGVAAEFAWIGQEERIDPEWTRPLDGRHVLEVFVKDKNVQRTYDVHEGQIIPIEGTDYKLTIQELRPSWPLMSPGFQNARTPIALVWVESPTQSFQRSVLQRYPTLNQDRDKEGKKINPDGGSVDTNLVLRYADASRDRFVIVAGERLSPTAIFTAAGGKRTVEKLEGNRPFASSAGVSLTMVDYIMRPEFTTRPTVIPPRNRRPLSNVRRSESMIRLLLKSKEGDWSKHVWVPFSIYNTEHDGTRPTLVRDVPGVGDLELIYGRAERLLPARLTLERLQTDYYPGRQQASMWTSYLREEEPETGIVRQKRAWLNNTAKVGEWRLFQSQAPNDGKSWTVLGVGNRQGVWTMLLGTFLITVGMIYAFSIAPILKRRRKERLAAMNDSRTSPPPTVRGSRSAESRKPATPSIAGWALAATVLLASSAFAAETHQPAAEILAIQGQIDVARLGRLALQHNWRYSTVDSWARDAVKSIHGSKALFGLDPVAAAMELMFNSAAHHGEPVIYIKDGAIRRDLTAHPVQLSESERARICETGRVSYEFLNRPEVAGRLKQLAGDMLKKTAMDRLQTAINYYEQLGFTFTIVPDKEGAHDTPWLPLAAVNPMSSTKFEGLGPEDIARVGDLRTDLQKAWQARDVVAINAAIARLEEVLPTLAPAGVYPSADARANEVTYRRMNLIRWAWMCYIIAFFVSIFAVATGYRWVRRFGLLFLVAALGLHGYDIALRWQVIGRIPVANMYEAVVSSTWVGALFGLILELGLKRRVFLLGASLLGFFALALPELLPDQVDNKLTTMMPILDDIMLRIHTVLIISSYAVITLAYGVANCYLFVAAFRDRVALAQGTIGAQVGAIAVLGLTRAAMIPTDDPRAFVLIMASAVAGGALLATGLCNLLLARRPQPAFTGPDAADFPVGRTVLEEFDFSHRVLLYTATVALFVGLVLGAVWADYSWGRPWGWDPKEVFALCTWLIYAIVIHVKFVTKRGALWTSVLSVVGFAIMQFNWWVVNFYIVGLHSYA
jgi:ABC-type transport system involved in cytochrome c biogenesis permease subunit